MSPEEHVKREWKTADPEYYRSKNGEYDIIDVIADYGLDFDLGCVVKYIFRAGRKPGNDFLTDLRKAKRVIERRIAREEGSRRTNEA